MAEPQNSPETLALARSGKSRTNCELLIERKFKEIPGVRRVGVDCARGYAEIEHAGELDIATLQRAVAEDGYVVSPWIVGAPSKNMPRDFLQIAGIFAVLLGILFSLQHFDLIPPALPVSATPRSGPLFLIVF